MVCNLVTYRARSAVREVGYALGFPRPLVDRVAKALETYDSVMVRRDLEADGGFAEFFRRPGEGEAAARAGDEARIAAEHAEANGLIDGMGQLNKRVPLVGKVPPWRQPPKPVDPNAPRPFAWLGEGPPDAVAPAPIGWGGPTTGTSGAGSGQIDLGGQIRTARWRESSPRQPRSRVGAPRRACPTGIVGSSSVPGSMAFLATCRSTPAGCL